MKRDKSIGLVIIGLGVCLFIAASLSDLLRDKTFSLGLAQVLLMFFGILVIGMGLLTICQKSVYEKVFGYLQLRWRNLQKVIGRRNLFVYFGILFVLLISIILFYAWGIEQVKVFPDYIGAGAPITIPQIAIALMAGAACVVPNLFGKSSRRSKIIDAVICVLLFVVAIKLWTSLPIQPTFFTRFIDKSSTIFYPFSDSRKYDMNALAFLNGAGWGFGSALQRPLYTFFWAMLHVLFNNNYSTMIFAQVVFFAILPVLAFMLGEKFGSKAIATVLALLIIYREYNQIILSFNVTLVSVQMIMSEIFTELFLVVLVLLTFRWFAHFESKNLAAITGIWLGLTILIRSQVLVLLAIYLAYFVYKYFFAKNKLQKSFLIFLIALACVLAPWMARNYVRNGSFSLDGSDYIYNIVTSNGNNATLTGDISQDSGNENLLRNVVAKGGLYFERTLAFTTNSILDSLYQFPFSFEPYTLRAYISSGPMGYPIPYEKLSTGQAICAFIQACLLVLGITFSWRRFGFKGLFPLLVYLSYDLSDAVLGYTGYRFIQPVDWIFLLYWSTGIVAFASIFLPSKVVFNLDAPNADIRNERKLNLLIMCCTVFAGLLLPVSELLVQAPVNPLPDISLIQKNADAALSQLVSPDEHTPLTLSNGFLGISGHGLYPEINYPDDKAWIAEINRRLLYPYPAYYSQHIAWDDASSKDLVSHGTNTLFFTLTTDKARDVLMEDPIMVGNGSGNFFFNDSPVFVYGCDEGDYIQAYYLQIEKGSTIYEIKSSLPIPASCTP